MASCGIFTPLPGFSFFTKVIMGQSKLKKN